MAELRIGMVGHAFMGAAHSQAWRTVNRVYDLPVSARMSVLCGRAPHRTMVVGQDDKQVADTARYLNLM